MASEPVSPIDPWESVSATLHFAELFPCPPSWKIDPQVLERNGFFYIWKGKGWVEHDGQRMDALPGDLFISRPGLRFSAGHDPQKPVTVLSTAFELRTAHGNDPLRRFDLPSRLRLSGEARATVLRLFTGLSAELQDPSPRAKLAARGLLLVPLSEVLRLTQSLPAACKTGGLAPLPGEETRVNAVLNYIDENLGEPLELRGLAKIAHVSPVYFSSLFRRQMGQPPMAYLRQRRIDLARSLLATGDQSVEEIAREVGFEDPFHFSRAFHRRVGTSPSAYRASLRKNPFLG